jgi:hypothetical protein
MDALQTDRPITIQNAIHSRCARCAEGSPVAPLRTADGRILWVHEGPAGVVAGCPAQELHPRLAIARRRASQAFA